jgi:hypothetical protein
MAACRVRCSATDPSGETTMTRATFEQVFDRLQANPVLPSFAAMHELEHAQLRLWRQIGGKNAKSVKQTRMR